MDFLYWIKLWAVTELYHWSTISNLCCSKTEPGKLHTRLTAGYGWVTKHSTYSLSEDGKLLFLTFSLKIYFMPSIMKVPWKRGTERRGKEWVLYPRASGGSTTLPACFFLLSFLKRQLFPKVNLWKFLQCLKTSEGGLWSRENPEIQLFMFVSLLGKALKEKSNPFLLLYF